MAVAVDFDPLLKLQLDELQRFLISVQRVNETRPEKIRGLAEHICEWTRTILSRSFGRIAFEEALSLQQSFESAANTIADFGKGTQLSVDDREAIAVYAEHVRDRIHHLPLDRHR